MTNESREMGTRIVGASTDSSNHSRQIVEERPLQGFEVPLSQLGESMGPDVIVAEIVGSIDLSVLVEAAYFLQQRHPALRAAIRWPGDCRSERPVLTVFAPDRDRLDVSELHESGSADAAPWRDSHGEFWQRAMHQLSLYQFDTDAGFMFRVVWIPGKAGTGGHIAVCSHHALVDGTSLMRLLHQMLQRMEAIDEKQRERGGSASEAAALLPAAVQSPLPPALFAQFHFSPLDQLLAKFGLRQVFDGHKAFGQKPWVPIATCESGAVAAPHIGAEFVFASGDERGWASLQKCCKARDATVGGAFAAAIQFALARHLHVHGLSLPAIGHEVAMPLSMNFNMRNRLEHAERDIEAIGLATSIAGVGVKVDPEIEFWALASRISERVRAESAQGLPKLFQCVTDKMLDYDTLLSRHGIDLARTSGTGEGVNISNVGKYPFASTVGSLSLRNVFGFTGSCLGGPVFIFWLRHIDNHLCYNASVSTPAADRSMLSTVFADVVDLMERRAHGASNELFLNRFAQSAPELGDTG